LIICVIIIFLRRRRKRKIIKKKKKKVKKKKVLKITKALPFYRRYILGKNDDKALKILVDFINTGNADKIGLELPITMKQAKGSKYWNIYVTSYFKCKRFRCGRSKKSISKTSNEGY
jgi:hypothetical protein